MFLVKQKITNLKHNNPGLSITLFTVCNSAMKKKCNAFIFSVRKITLKIERLLSFNVNKRTYLASPSYAYIHIIWY